MAISKHIEQDKFAFRIDEATHATGLGRSFLYEQMTAGELKSVKIGGRRLILREDLLAFLHKTEAGPIEPALMAKNSRKAEIPTTGSRRKRTSTETVSGQLPLL